MGRVVGNFELVTAIGPPRGVQTYRATDRATGRAVCLRLLTAPLAQEPGAIDRFLARAALARTLDVDRVAPIAHVGRTAEGAYVVSPGHVTDDLETYAARRGPLHWPLTRTLLFYLCVGLHQAHRRGIGHGELRAEHCVLTNLHDDRGNPIRDLVVTGLGAALGEPAVLLEPAPARVAAVHDDLHAVGRVALHMLLGEPPTDEHVRTILSQGTDAAYNFVYRAATAQPVAIPSPAADILRRLLTDDLARAFPDALAALAALAVLDPPDVQLQHVASGLRLRASTPSLGRTAEIALLVSGALYLLARWL